MKIQFSVITGGMIWGTLPLMGGLFYWEHTLHLSAAGHILMQILLLPVVFGWAYFWNTTAEFSRLSHLLDANTTETKMRYPLIKYPSYEEKGLPSNSGVPSTNDTLSKDESSIEILFNNRQYPCEVRYYVSNH